MKRRRQRCRRRVSESDDTDDRGSDGDVKVGLTQRDRVCQELRDLQVCFFIYFCVCRNFLFEFLFVFEFLFEFLLKFLLLFECTSGKQTAAQRRCRGFWTLCVTANSGA